jgi:hypothetical protein
VRGGPTITALHIADPPERWSALGFAVAGDGRCQVGAVRLALGEQGDGIVAWTLSGASSAAGRRDIEGIPTRHGDSQSRPVGAHPNTAVCVDHVVLATPDLDRTLLALARAGMRLRRERRAGALRQAFFRHGEAVLEVVGPVQVQERGPARLWGLTVTVADLPQCSVRLGSLIGPVHTAVQPGRQIAVVAPAAGLTTHLALMSATGPATDSTPSVCR